MSRPVEMPPIQEFVASTADTDAYQFFMSKVAKEEFPGVKARYEFIARDPNLVFPEGFDRELRQLVDAMKTLIMSEKERDHLLKSHPYIGKEYADWAFDFRFDPSQVHISQENGKLRVWIEGPWEEAIFWETPLMALIVSLYNHMMDRKPHKGWEKNVVSEAKMAKKANKNNGWMYSEFGARRRHSLAVHDKVLDILIEHSGGAFRATSDPHFAAEKDTEVVGTFAHQFMMFMAAKFGYRLANAKALEYWRKVYTGNLPAALTDTFTHQIFFDDFDPIKDNWVKVFRHDSGPESEFRDIVARNIAAKGRHNRDYGLLYTNGLTMKKAIAEGEATEAMGFSSGNSGIGTHLTHNLTGVSGLNVVIKPTHFYIPGENGEGEWRNVTKLSEEPGKTSGPAKDQAMRELGLSVAEVNGVLRYVRVKN